MSISKSAALSAAILSIGISGCANAISGALNAIKADSERSEMEANKKPKMTQLQTRNLQTRTYEEANTSKILRVALAVLQDDGFVVSNANTDLGLLSASKNLHEKKVDDGETAFMKGFFGIGSVSTQKWSTIEATVTVTPFGAKTRVRLSARLTAISSNGSSNYEMLADADYYQNFFATLEKGLFIERQKL